MLVCLNNKLSKVKPGMTTGLSRFMFATNQTSDLVSGSQNACAGNHTYKNGVQCASSLIDVVTTALHNLQIALPLVFVHFKTCASLTRLNFASTAKFNLIFLSEEFRELLQHPVERVRNDVVPPHGSHTSHKYYPCVHCRQLVP